ncbi:MAG TPA: nuclear transport factor 2 family protein [Terrimesophilobacter sp.]|nr:nuclear transport factor 2 family protein [Terrimesophilobacter sp.]
MQNQTVLDWLEGYRKAWERRDADAAAALFTDDSLYREQPYQEPFVGQHGVHDYWTGVTATQSEVKFRYGTPVVEGSRAAVEWWVTMLNGGMEVTLAGQFLLHFDDSGKCRELREYWHFSEGRLEPHTGWGE